jgi:hypothetical protein
MKMRKTEIMTKKTTKVKTLLLNLMRFKIIATLSRSTHSSYNGSQVRLRSKAPLLLLFQEKEGVAQEVGQWGEERRR